jgi:hypothetical protein
MWIPPWHSILIMAGALAVATALQFVLPSIPEWWFWLFWIVLTALAVALWHVWDLWRALGIIQRHPWTAQHELLKVMADAHAASLGPAVYSEAPEPPEHSIERFRTRQSAVRANDVAFWVAAGSALTAVLLLVLQYDYSRPQVVGVVSWLLGAALLAWATRRRATQLDQTLEITPFAITAISADGSRRTLQWRDAHRVTLHRFRRCVVVHSSTGDTRLSLPFELNGLYRAIELVLRYGGFVPAAV